jgi:hypothetical protein
MGTSHTILINRHSTTGPAHLILLSTIGAVDGIIIGPIPIPAILYSILPEMIGARHVGGAIAYRAVSKGHQVLQYTTATTAMTMTLIMSISIINLVSLLILSIHP